MLDGKQVLNVAIGGAAGKVIYDALVGVLAYFGTSIVAISTAMTGVVFAILIAPETATGAKAFAILGYCLFQFYIISKNRRMKKCARARFAG